MIESGTYLIAGSAKTHSALRFSAPQELIYISSHRKLIHFLPPLNFFGPEGNGNMALTWLSLENVLDCARQVCNFAGQFERCAVRRDEDHTGFLHLCAGLVSVYILIE